MNGCKTQNMALSMSTNEIALSTNELETMRTEVAKLKRRQEDMTKTYMQK